MVVSIYSVKDLVADEFGPVFQAKNDAVAHRQYLHLLNSDESIDKADYMLWRLGSFDTEKGKIFIDDNLEGRYVVTSEKYQEVEDEQGI